MAVLLHGRYFGILEVGVDAAVAVGVGSDSFQLLIM